MKMNVLYEEMSVEEKELWDQIPEPAPKWLKYEEPEEDEDFFFQESKDPLLELEQLRVQRDIDTLTKSGLVESEPKLVKTGWIEITSLDILFDSDWNTNLYPSVKNPNRNEYLSQGRIMRDWELKTVKAGQKNYGSKYIVIPEKYYGYYEKTSSGMKFRYVDDNYKYRATGRFITGGLTKTVNVNIPVDCPIYEITYEDGSSGIVAPVIYFNVIGRYIYNQFPRASLSKKAELSNKKQLSSLKKLSLEVLDDEYQLTDNEIVREVNSYVYKVRKIRRLESKIENIKSMIKSGKKIKNISLTIHNLNRELVAIRGEI